MYQKCNALVQVLRPKWSSLSAKVTVNCSAFTLANSNKLS